MAPHMNRTLLSLILGLGLPGAFTAVYANTLNFSPLWVWLVTINLTLMALMGKDKLTAKRNGASRTAKPALGRTPELTLLTLTVLGATPAMFLSRRIFNHKTTKQEFTYALYGALALQIALIIYFWSSLKYYL